MRLGKSYIVLALLAALATPGASFGFEGEWGPAKGDWEVNLKGNSSQRKYKDFDATYSGSDIKTTIGYFVLDSLEVGLNLDLNSSKSSGSDTNNTSSDSSYPTLFAAYHLNIPGNLTPYAGFTFGSGSTKYEDGNKREETYFGIMLGAKYFFVERAAFLAQFDFSSYSAKWSQGGDAKGTDVTLNFGVSVFF